MYQLQWPVVYWNISATTDMNFLKAVAMYDMGFVGSRRALSVLFATVNVGLLGAVMMVDDVLDGLT